VPAQLKKKQTQNTTEIKHLPFATYQTTFYGDSLGLYRLYMYMLQKENWHDELALSVLESVAGACGCRP